MKHLNQYFEVFRSKAEILAENLKKKSGIGPFSIYDDMAANTFDIIFESTLGIKSTAQENIDNPELIALKQMGRLIAERMTQPLLYNQSIYEFTNLYKQLKNATDIFGSSIEKNIARGYEKFIKSKPNISQQNADNGSSPSSILQLILQANGSEMSGLKDEIMAIVLAGTDTSAVTLSFVCLMLAKYQHVRDKVYQEVLEVLGDPTRPLEHDDLPKLKYTDAVLRETLRVYSPGMLLLRKIDKDLVLPSGQVLVKGTGAMIHLWAIHRHPQYWGADAEQFRPERFFDAPPNHPAAFLPFSYGPRNCIGYQFAMMAMKTTIATLVRHYQILPAKEEDVENIYKREEMRTTFDILIRDVDMFPIRLQARNII